MIKKTPLYSRARAPARPDTSQATALPPSLTPPAPAAKSARSRLPPLTPRMERRLWALAVLALTAAIVGLGVPSSRQPPALTIKQIDAALRQSLEKEPLPAVAAKAFEAVRPSVVRVVGYMSDEEVGDQPTLNKPGSDAANQAPRRTPDRGHQGVGTGVVIVDNGTILTNLHVVQGARRVRVTFADGHESDAQLISVDAPNDLAVLRARSIPDDLHAATLRSTADLAPGDPVVAVGFPFGIGPSASAGVVSGLNREFRSPEGDQLLTKLIQFDAAANPGNSGGPLVTADGEVVGIVTAIFNPSRQRVFIGIGFAVPIENAAAAVGMPPF